MEINTSVPGRIVVAMAAAEALVGSGDLLTLDFDVVGNDGTVSVLDIESAELNEGAIEALLVDGLFQTPGIFTDGFESGDTGEWSTVVP